MRSQHCFAEHPQPLIHIEEFGIFLSDLASNVVSELPDVFEVFGGAFDLVLARMNQRVGDGLAELGEVIITLLGVDLGSGRSDESSLSPI
jgi:hypothetical protein